VTVDSGSARARDFFLVYGEAGTYEARGSTDNFVGSNVLLGTVTLTETGLGLVAFASASHRYTRLSIASGTPAVAIAAIGAALESPVFLDGEFSPIDRKVHGNTNRNENGHPLGRAVYFESWMETIRLVNVSWTWARSSFLPAWKTHLRGSPFGFAWETDTYATDVRLVQAGDEVRMPHRAGALADVEFEVQGVAP
jgi:hypothetical protein